MKRKSVIIFAAITFSSLGVCAENNNTITAAQVKATPYTTVFFARVRNTAPPVKVFTTVDVNRRCSGS